MCLADTFASTNNSELTFKVKLSFLGGWAAGASRILAGKKLSQC